MAPKKAVVADDDVANKYQKLTPREHVLKRPGMYVGSTETEAVDMWIYDEGNAQMVKRPVNYIPALNKIVDEVVVNAIDHVIRQKEVKAACKTEEDAKAVNMVKNIRIKVDKETGIIECTNDGDGLEAEKHPQHGMYIGEMVFGNLMTSTNYDDDVERTIGGVNGFGAKLTNIFSEWFEIETVDARRKMCYKQRWENNMSVTGTPTLIKCTKKPYTVVRFKPDYARFGMPTLSEDMYKVLERRAYDACAVTDADINIFYNEKKLEYKSFEKYCDIFLGPKDKRERVYEKISDRWEVIASYSDFNGFEQISFVNGICTLRGGKHVDYVLGQIVKKMTELILKKKKDAIIKPQSIKDNLILFVKSTIVNPAFDSQSKETLTTPVSKFGSKGELSDKFMDKLFKTELTSKIMNMCDTHLEKEAKKSDGKKTSVIRGIENLDDANWAGTAKSNQCTLILTEGLSAKTMAISGLSVIGRDRYGVFPLRGKLLNVKEAAVKKLAENEEITNIKKIMGLEAGKVYKTTDELRYGRVMLLTDADDDGAHIKGLLMNMFHTLWPSLVINDGFITTMLTPVVRAVNGNTLRLFFSVAEFSKWRNVSNGESSQKGWQFKYLKGLGSSKEKEAKEYFRDMRMVTYKWTGDESDKALDLAFNKKRADDRKLWLGAYDKDNVLDFSKPDVPYEDFIHKELIHFSNYDIERSIPSMCDGLKISQRKVLYGCFKRNLTTEVKVAQLTGYVSEHAAYHHGDASLSSTIVGMAQDYVSSNNINILKPNGQFGTRVQGGKDAASARYICTQLFDLTRKVFKKEDDQLLTYKDDDGFLIEPEFYVPIVPMVLINGAVGIGTGFSTNVPCYNPEDVVKCLHAKLSGKDHKTVELRPWYRGFSGEIVQDGDGRFSSYGRVTVEGPTTMRVTELPIGYWTEDFKNDLEKFVDNNPDVKKFDSYYKPRDVNFLITFANEVALQKHMQPGKNGMPQIMTDLKLVGTKNMTTTNMYLFNDKLQIKKYATPHDIIDDFYEVRLRLYATRKAHLEKALKEELNILSAKLRFVEAIMNDEIVVYKKTRDAITTLLDTHGYPKIEDSYDYLLRMQIYNFTDEKVKALEKEIESAQQKLVEVQKSTEKTMWLKELEEFATEYQKFLLDWDVESRDEENDGATKGVKKIIKRAPKRIAV